MILTILTVLNYISFGIFDNDNRYQEAYSYIVSSEIVQYEFQHTVELNPNSINIWVSDEILSYNPFPFIQDIVDYQYSSYSDSTKKVVEEVLLSYPDQRSLKKRNSNLLKLNLDTTSTYNVYLFFSEINENRLKAELFIKGTNYPTEYDLIIQPGKILTFLFYFDENLIRKVFYKKLAG